MSTGATGTIPVFDCIPDLGSFIPDRFINPFLVRELKCCKPNGN